MFDCINMKRCYVRLVPISSDPNVHNLVRCRSKDSKVDTDIAISICHAISVGRSNLSKVAKLRVQRYLL